MRLYPVYIALLLLFIVLQLLYSNNAFSEADLEGYDMTKVNVIETPFWCSATPEERAEAISKLTDEQKAVALNVHGRRRWIWHSWSHSLRFSCERVLL